MTPGKAIPSVVETGQVLATVNDWRAIVIFAMFLFASVLIIMVAIIVALLRSTKSERKEMSDERGRMWGVAKTMGTAADNLAVEMRVQAALLARVEGALTRNENGRT